MGLAVTTPPLIRVWQQVRVVVCGQDLHEHVGQVGTVLNVGREGHATVRLDQGVCRARSVEVVAEPFRSRPADSQ